MSNPKALLDEDGRCRTTELLPEQCGCRRHRGPAPEAPDTSETVGQPIEAQHATPCPACDQPVIPGQLIVRLADGTGWIHATFRDCR